MLERLRNDALTKNIEIGYVFEYYPRRVQDYLGLQNYYGKEVEEDFLDYKSRINSEREERGELPLNNDETAAEFDKYIREKDLLIHLVYRGS